MQEIEICRVQKEDADEQNNPIMRVYRVVGDWQEQRIIIPGRPPEEHPIAPNTIKTQKLLQVTDGVEEWAEAEADDKQIIFDGMAMLFAENRISVSLSIQMVASIMQQALRSLSGMENAVWFQKIGQVLGIQISLNAEEPPQMPH